MHQPTAMLREGGRLLATFADAGSESGFARMMRDLGRHSATDPATCTRFHWVDRTLLEAVLPRLGFALVSVVHGPDGGLDIARLYVTAELIDPELGARAEGIDARSHYQPLHLSPAGRRLCRTAGALPVTEAASAGLVRLPLDTHITAAEQERVVGVLLEAVDGLT